MSGSEDGSACVWMVDTGEVATQLRGHTAAVLDVEWSRRSGLVVSGSEDGTAILWAAGGRE